MWIDAHCHLERETFGAGVDDVIARARAAGLTHLMAVGASRVTGGAHEAVALAARHADVFASVGIHPHEAEGASPAALADIVSLLAHPKVRAVGEVGLDFYHNNAAPAAQRAAFAAFLQMAADHHLPIMLHIRAAHALCLEMVDSLGLPPKGGMIHCFTGPPAEAEAYLKRGFMLSIPGVVTFRSAAPLREAVREVPLDRLMLETDCPYLAPVPHRGKRNEPALMVHTAAAVAELLQVEVAALAAATHANTCRFFALPEGAAVGPGSELTTARPPG